MGKRQQKRIPIKTGRVVHHFWLNIWKPLESELDKQVAELKKQRQFAETVRDGLRLILDLRAGSLDVLFELFPHLEQRLTGQGVQSPTPPDVDYDKLTTEIAEKVVLMGGANRLEMSASHRVDSPAPKLGQGIQQQLSAPVYDDDDLPMMKITKDTKTDAGANFLKGVMGLQ